MQLRKVRELGRLIPGLMLVIACIVLGCGGSSGGTGTTGATGATGTNGTTGTIGTTSATTSTGSTSATTGGTTGQITGVEIQPLDAGTLLPGASTTFLAIAKSGTTILKRSDTDSGFIFEVTPSDAGSITTNGVFTASTSLALDSSATVKVTFDGLSTTAAIRVKGRGSIALSAIFAPSTSREAAGFIGSLKATVKDPSGQVVGVPACMTRSNTSVQFNQLLNGAGYVVEVQGFRATNCSGEVLATASIGTSVNGTAGAPIDVSANLATTITGITIEPQGNPPIEPGAQVAFTATARSGGIVVLTSTQDSSFVFSVNPSIIGSINQTTGVFTAQSNLQSDTPGTVKVSFSGLSATADVTIKGGFGHISGVVYDDVLASGAEGIEVVFYSGGVRVGSAVSDAQGNFIATVQPGPTVFTLGTIPNYYYNAFTYQTKHYSSLDPSCMAPGPNVSVGSTVSMPNVIHVSLTSGPPPPPPDGCQ